eukprot:966916_1
MAANINILDHRIMDDEDMFNIKMVEMLNNPNITKSSVVQFCQSLYQRKIDLDLERTVALREKQEREVCSLKSCNVEQSVNIMSLTSKMNKMANINKQLQRDNEQLIQYA